MGDQRGSDTLVVPLITSNDGLSIAFNSLIALNILNLQNDLAWACMINFVRSPNFFRNGLDGRFTIF